MTSRNEMPFDIKAFRADCFDLSALEVGAYVLILHEMYLSADGWIVESDLPKVARVARQHWRAVRQALDKFLICVDGRVTQKRIQRDRHQLTPESVSPTECTDCKNGEHIESKLLPLRISLDSESRLESEPRAKRTRTRTTLPEDAMPTVEHLAYCKEHGFDQGRCISMWRAFKDYHRARGNRMADWLAAWRTWVRNEAKYHPYGYRPNGGDNGKRSIGAATDKLVRWADEEAARDARDQDLDGFLPR